MTTTESQFVDFVQAECDKHRVKLELRPVDYLVVNKRFRCTGFFDPYERHLVVATKDENYFQILVHEYAHVTQWLDENCEPWKLEERIFGGTMMEAWLMGENVRHYKRCIASVRDLELDNEIRTVNIIKEHGLEIDLDEYVRKANCYVLIHNRMMKTRKWVTSKLIHKPEILEKMSPNFDMRYDKNTAAIDKLFESHGY